MKRVYGILVAVLAICIIVIGVLTYMNISKKHNYISSSYDKLIDDRCEYTEKNSVFEFVSKDYSSNSISFYYSDSEPSEFYIIKCKIKLEDVVYEKKDLSSICLYVKDDSDFNRDNVKKYVDYSVDNKWVSVERVVKLSDTGSLLFGIDVGTSECKVKGKISIKNVEIIPANEHSKYHILKSDDNSVRFIMLSEDINNSKISDKRLIEWVNGYSKIRKTLSWIVGDKEPYSGVTDYIATEKFEYYGLAGNPIYINQEYVKEDLESIQNKNLVWEYVHEMSHTFDGAGSDKIDGNWNFDPEFFATFKCACALSINGYSFNEDGYSGKDIYQHFANSNGLDNGVFSDEGLIYRLLFIMNNQDIGYDVLRDVFLEYDNVEKNDKEDFFYFIKVLSEKSSVDIQSEFSEKEWNTVCLKYQ